MVDIKILLFAGCQASLMTHTIIQIFNFIFLDCRKCILIIKNTLLKSGQAKSKISKCNNRSTNVSQNGSVRPANEGTLNTMLSTLDFCFEVLCCCGTALALCAISMNISKP